MSRWHTFGTREGKNLSHPPESNRRPADYDSLQEPTGGNQEDPTRPEDEDSDSD